MLWFFLLLQIVASSALAQCSFTDDTDMGGGNIVYMAVTSKEACCSACSIKPKCSASVFFDGYCYLKDSTASPVSGVAGRVMCTPGSAPPPTPAGATTSFSTQGRKIMIQTPSGEELFKVRGFSYSNARIGEGQPLDGYESQYDPLMRPELCQRDFDRMRALNVNTIKVYVYNNNMADSASVHKGCLDFAWNGGVKPIFISLSIWINVLPMCDPSNVQCPYRAQILSRYAAMVKETAGHPAVFAYSVGSEFSGDPNVGPNSPYWNDFKTVVSSIRGAMGGAKKLVTTGTYQTTCRQPLCPAKILDLGHVINGEAAGANVDFWGVDIYSPHPNALWLREAIFKATKRPFVFPEYGLSYQPAKTPDPAARAVQELALVGQMENYSYTTSDYSGNEGTTFEPDAPIYAGGLLFEWNDEYWKGAATDSLCHAGTNSAQGWYGKNAVALKPGCPCVAPEQRSVACYLDDLVPRPVLGALSDIWRSYIPSVYSLNLMNYTTLV